MVLDVVPQISYNSANLACQRPVPEGRKRGVYRGGGS